MPAPASAAAPTPAPALPEDVLNCPLCGYDLRGLVDPRCPECGYSFVWDELRDPARRLHRYLFEHHPQRNAASFLRTFLAGWRPGRFWRTLYPTQPSDLGRLMLYQFLITLACLAVPVVVFTLLLLVRTWQLQVPSFWNVLRIYRPPRQILLAWLQLTLWPWLTFAALMIFQATLRRARIKPVHVLRCVIYSCDVAALGAAVLLLGVACEYYQWGGQWFWTWDGYVRAAVRIVMFGLPLIVSWRLAMACRHYIRIEKAIVVAILTQIMLTLLALRFALEEDVVNFFMM